MNFNEIILTADTDKDIPYLKEKMEVSFSVAVNEHFGDNEPEGGPPSEQLENAYSKPNGSVYSILKDGTPVGGAVLTSECTLPHKANNYQYVMDKLKIYK